MPLIAITREMGSLGIEVAEHVAAELKLPLIHHEIIEHLADKMRVRKSHVQRLLDGKAGIFEKLTADKTSMSIYTAAEIMDLAAREGGCVLRGWGAAQLLRTVPHAVCVRVCAPAELRKQRMLERLGSNDGELIDSEIKISDEAHAAIIRRHFGVNWQDAELYDIVCNTERMSVDECVDVVLKLVRNNAFAETPASQRRLADLKMSALIKSALHEHAPTRAVQISIDVNDGAVFLQGIVGDGSQRAAVERAVQGVAGVRSVANKLRSRDDFKRKLVE
jgi:cytidylate kinase